MKRLFMFVCMLFPLSVFATDTICPAGYQPVEYIELEYIESSKTQYIDTGVVLNQDCSVEAKFRFLNQEGSTTGNFIFGARVSMTSQAFTLAGYSSGTRWAPNYGTQMSEFGQSDTNIHKIYRNKNVVYMDGVLAYTNTETTFTTPDTVYIFACHQDGKAYLKSAIQLYELKIWDDADILIRDFVPVRRLFDSAVGMYDRVENKFYGNNGTGEFIAGPEKTGASFITDENGDAFCESCPANTYKPNAGNEQCTKCPEYTFSPVGSTSISDCGKILRIKDYVVYMPLGKRTEHGLCVMSDGKKYCADVYERQ